jgi:hypothetical protein
MGKNFRELITGDKKLKRLFLLIFLVVFGASSAPAQSIKLPFECQRILERHFRGWRLAQVPNEVSEFFRNRQMPFKPNLVKGDFDGNAKTDYAVLISHGTLYNSQKEPVGERRWMVAFIRTKKGFRHFRFEGSEFIALLKKGLKAYDYQTDKNFRYRTDAIFNGFWEKGGSSYVFEKGKFRAIVTSD